MRLHLGRVGAVYHKFYGMGNVMESEFIESDKALILSQQYPPVSPIMSIFGNDQTDIRVSIAYSTPKALCLGFPVLTQYHFSSGQTKNELVFVAL